MMAARQRPGSRPSALANELDECHKWVADTHGGDLEKAAKLAQTLSGRKRVALAGYLRCVSTSRAVKDLVLLALRDRRYVFVVTLSVRPMIEWYARAHWLDTFADNQEATKFLGGKERPELRPLLDKLIGMAERTRQSGKPLLGRLRERIGELNDFLHGGPDVLAGGIQDVPPMDETTSRHVARDIHALGCVMFLACERILHTVDDDPSRIASLCARRDEFQNLFEFDPS